MELEESGSLTSDHATQLQYSKQYGTGTEADILIDGIALKSRNKPIYGPWGCKETQLRTHTVNLQQRRQGYNGEKSLQ